MKMALTLLLVAVPWVLAACEGPQHPFPGRACPSGGMSLRYEPPESCGGGRTFDLVRSLAERASLGLPPPPTTNQAGDREPRALTLGAAANEEIATLRKAWESVIGPIPERLPDGEVAPLDPCEEAPVLTPWQQGEVRRQSYTLTRVTYRGAHGAFIPAYLLVPLLAAKENRRLPAVIVAHQSLEVCGKDEAVGICKEGYPPLALARTLAEAGLVTLAPDTVGYGERRRCNVRGGVEYADAAPLLDRYPQASMIGLRISDLQRGLAYLQQRPEVDPLRLGIAGHSSGGVDALFLPAMEPRIRCAFSNAGPNLMRRETLQFLLQKSYPLPPGISRWASFGYLPALGLYKDVAESPVEFHQLYALIAPRGLFVSLMEDDSLAPKYDRIDFMMRQGQRVYEALGAPSGRFAYRTITSGLTPECRDEFGVAACLAHGYEACQKSGASSCASAYEASGMNPACVAEDGAAACARRLYYERCRVGQGNSAEECRKRFVGTTLDQGDVAGCIEKGTEEACGRNHGLYPETEELAVPYLVSCLSG